MSDRAWPHVPAVLWERVSHARELLVALDYDGTLAPFRVRRSEAVPSPGVLAVVKALAALPETSVVVVSGRPVSELLELLASGRQADLDDIQLVGEHGWERLRPGELQRHAISARTAAGLVRARQLATEAGLSDLLEVKRTAVAIHTRALSADEARTVQARALDLWSPLVSPGELRLDEIDGGVELRAASRTKATVLRELFAESSSATLFLYVGDDTTDEDAFRAGGHVIGLRVGDPQSRTAAMGTIASCEHVVRWLETLHSVRARDRTRPSLDRAPGSSGS